MSSLQKRYLSFCALIFLLATLLFSGCANINKERLNIIISKNNVEQLSIASAHEADQALEDVTEIIKEDVV